MPKKRKWTGILTRNLLSVGDSLAGKEYPHKKGQIVQVRKTKQWGENGEWTGDYEYHYTDENDSGLVRQTDLFLENEVDTDNN